MRVAFTGHRDKTADRSELQGAIPNGATCVHGGAIGFDSQVNEVATAMGMTCDVIRPDYRLGRGAPLIRNRVIVDSCEMLIACYDGRPIGGTAYTVRYAKQRGKPVKILRPAHIT